MRDVLEFAVDRLVCVFKGHKWDSDRTVGPYHVRDFCWRCDAVRKPR